VTKDIQRKIESLFGAFLNLYCVRLPVSERRDECGLACHY
jgi:hypothetical protein